MGGLVNDSLKNCMISLRDSNFSDNEAELLLGFKNRVFDGETYVSYVDLVFRFGIQCRQSFPGVVKKYLQEVSHEICWTNRDIDSLSSYIDKISEQTPNNSSISYDSRQYIHIWLLEPEAEGLCFYSNGDPNVELYLTCGVNGVGSTIKIWTTKHELQRWIAEIKKCFYKI